MKASEAVQHASIAAQHDRQHDEEADGPVDEDRPHRGERRIARVQQEGPAAVGMHALLSRLGWRRRPAPASPWNDRVAVASSSGQVMAVTVAICAGASCVCHSVSRRIGSQPVEVRMGLPENMWWSPSFTSVSVIWESGRTSRSSAKAPSLRSAAGDRRRSSHR